MQGPFERRILEACRRENRPLPEKVRDAPELPLGLFFYYEAWRELGSCRPLGLVEGVIPWTAIEAYCDAIDADEEERVDIHHHIAALERAYMGHRAKKDGKRSTGEEPGDKTGGGRSGRRAR